MNGLAKTFVFAAFVAVVAGCGMDSAQLGEYVRKEMQEELTKNDDVFKALKMSEVRLVKMDDVQYEGVGKGEISGCPVKFAVKCKYDGKTVLWDASLLDDNIVSLTGAVAGRAIYEKIKASWPEVKKSISEKCAAMSKAAGEYCDSAAKKAEECIDSVMGKKKGEGAGAAPAAPTAQ